MLCPILEASQPPLSLHTGLQQYSCCPPHTGQISLLEVLTEQIPVGKEESVIYTVLLTHNFGAMLPELSLRS